MGVTDGLAIKRNNKETKSRVLKRYLPHWQVNEILKYKQHPNYTINSNRFFVLFFGFVCVFMFMIVVVVFSAAVGLTYTICYANV